MGRLYCKCLNIKIGHSNDLSNPRVIKVDQLCSSLPKQLVGKDVVEIQQDVGGIVMVRNTIKLSIVITTVIIVYIIKMIRLNINERSYMIYKGCSPLLISRVYNMLLLII